MEDLKLNDFQSLILDKLLQNKKSWFQRPKSFYIYGDTGSGKTTIIERFLMQSDGKKFLFMHFHDYLLDVTKLMTKGSLAKVAKEIAKDVDILCFDEFFIESIADAKVLYDVLRHLMKYKVSIVTTSNFAPEDLYKSGFNRHVVFPMFSNFICEKMEVIHIHDTLDYRTVEGKKPQQITFDTLSDFENKFHVFVNLQREAIQVDLNHTVQIAGRFENGAVVEYDDLFKKHSSIKCYRKLSRTFIHIHVMNMKTFTHENEDEAIRFRNFIDILYTRGMIFSCDGISSSAVFSDVMLENIKFKRCYSRLQEMQTSEYIFSEAKNFKRKLAVSSAKFFDELFATMLK